MSMSTISISTNSSSNTSMRIMPIINIGCHVRGIYTWRCGSNERSSSNRNCETPRKSNFSKKGKIIILVKIRNFSRSWMMKRISPLESSREI